MKKKIITALVAVVIGHVGVLWAVGQIKSPEFKAIEKVLAIGIEVVGGKPWSDETAKRAKSAAKEATKNAAAARTEARRKKPRQTTKPAASKAGASKPSSNHRPPGGKRKRGPKRRAA